MSLRKHRHVYRYISFYAFFVLIIVLRNCSRVWDSDWTSSAVFLHTINTLRVCAVWMANEKEMREKRKRSNKINITLSKSIIVSINSHTLLFTFAICCCGGHRKQREPVFGTRKTDQCMQFAQKIYRPIVYAASKACDSFLGYAWDQIPICRGTHLHWTSASFYFILSPNCELYRFNWMEFGQSVM